MEVDQSNRVEKLQYIKTTQGTKYVITVFVDRWSLCRGAIVLLQSQVVPTGRSALQASICTSVHSQVVTVDRWLV